VGVSLGCRHRERVGADACSSACPALEAPAVFLHASAASEDEVPPSEPHVVDVAVLDMHHGWPNLGHAAIVHAVRAIACDLTKELRSAGLSVRAISYDVRRGLVVPDRPGGRFGVYVGTGGPGHLDPRRNDGRSQGAQGIAENPAWEGPLFGLFEAIHEDRDAVLVAVCHTFGVMCRWLDVAEPVLRGSEKGGKSAGVVTEMLEPAAAAHPWFGRFAEQLPDHVRFPVLDNRLYDLVPTGRGAIPVVALARDLMPDGAPGNALTLIEVARDAAAIMPRVFGVNFHPEVVDRATQLTVLRQKRESGEVSEPWYQERLRTMTEPLAGPRGERLLWLSASYSFHGPLRYHVLREIERRAESLGRRLSIEPEMARLAYSLDDEPDG
jgi:hypothetical protein